MPCYSSKKLEYYKYTQTVYAFSHSNFILIHITQSIIFLQDVKCISFEKQRRESEVFYLSADCAKPFVAIDNCEGK